MQFNVFSLGMLNDNRKIDYRKFFSLSFSFVYSRLSNCNTNDTGHPQQWSGSYGSLTATVSYQRSHSQGLVQKNVWGAPLCYHSWPSTQRSYHHGCSLIHTASPTFVPEMTYYMLNETLTFTHSPLCRPPVRRSDIHSLGKHLVCPASASCCLWSCQMTGVQVCVWLTHIIIKTHCCFYDSIR